MVVVTAFLLLLALIVVYPIGRLLVNSFFELRLADATDAAPPFVGWRNYQDIWYDLEFWSSLKNTILIAIVTVPGIAVGLAGFVGEFADSSTGVSSGFITAAMGVATFTGLISAWFFNYDHGLVNDILTRLGFEPQLWLTKPTQAKIAIWLTIIWKTSSFMALILLAGLQMIPRSLYEAATVDGASRLQQFWHITLPMLAPSMNVALIFRTITAFQTFDVPFTMTHGGLGYATETLAMYIHKMTIDYLDVGYGSAWRLPCLFCRCWSQQFTCVISVGRLKRCNSNSGRVTH